MRRAALWCAGFCIAACGNVTPPKTDDAGVDAADLDVTPPLVVSVTPSNAAESVLPGATIAITFSEAMSQATLASAITLTPSAPFAVAWDDATLTATVTPSSPMHRAVGYTLDVSAAATDLAGNALAAHRSTFAIEASPTVRIDTGGSMTMSNPRIAYDTAGNAVAVWVAADSAQEEAFYALYTASAGTWAPEVRIAGNVSGVYALDVVTNGNTFVIVAGALGTVAYVLDYDPNTTAWVIDAGTTLSNQIAEIALVTNGTQYMVAISDATGIRASIFNGTAWSSLTSVSSARAESSTMRVASDGDAFAIAWLQRLTYDVVHLRVHEAGAWQPVVTANQSAAGHARELAIAGSVNQTGVGLAWIQRTGLDALATVRYVRTGAGTTGALQAVDRPTDVTPALARSPRIVGGPAGAYGVMWTDSGRIWFSERGATAWTASDQVAMPSSLSGTFHLRRAGARYLALWTAPSGDAFPLYARVRDSGTWDMTTMLGDATAVVPEVSSVGASGFGVAWREIPTTGPSRIVRNLYLAGAWGTTSVVSTAVDGASSPWIGARNANFVTAWSQDDKVVARAGAGAETLTAMQHPARVANVTAVASGGRTLATWLQGTGQGEAVHASVYDDSTGWSSPHRVAAPGNLERRLATRNGTFMIETAGATTFHNGASWQQTIAVENDGIVRALDANADEYMIVYIIEEGQSAELYFRTSADGAWSARAQAPHDGMDFDEGEALYRLVPTAHGFFALWRTNNGPRYAIFDGNTWSASASLPAGLDIDHAMASSGAGLVIATAAYNSTDDNYQVIAAVHDGTAWGTVTTVASDIDLSIPLAVTASSSGYAIAWRKAGLPEAAIYTSAWSAPQVLTTVDPMETLFEVKLASDGAGYLAVWRTGNGAMARRHQAGAWGAPEAIENAAGTLSLAGGAEGYRFSGANEIASSQYGLQVGIVRATAMTLVQLSTTLIGATNHTTLATGTSFSTVWTTGDDPAFEDKNALYGVGAR